MRDRYPSNGNVYKAARISVIAGASAFALFAAGCGQAKPKFHPEKYKYSIIGSSLRQDLRRDGEKQVFKARGDQFNVSDGPVDKKGRYAVRIGGVISCEGWEDPDRLTVYIPAVHDGELLNVGGCDNPQEKTFLVPKNSPIVTGSSPVEVDVLANGNFEWAVVAPDVLNRKG